MHLDAAEIQEFYAENPLGAYVADRLAAKLTQFWPGLHDLTVAGFGFVQPIFESADLTAARLLNIMPDHQGFVRWPSVGGNRTVLTHEFNWPLLTGSVDRLVMLHGLENSGDPGAVLSECWRVLAPEGRILIFVPNRAGLWARRDATPFGFGHPYLPVQLEIRLEKRKFEVLRSDAALFSPPSGRRIWNRFRPAMERFGSHAPMRFAGGVVVQEACKRIFQMHRPPLAEKVANRLKALEGLAAPGAKPVSGRTH